MKVTFSERCVVYNRRVNPLTQGEDWVATALDGVFWQGGGAVSDRKEPRSGNVLILIPHAVRAQRPYVQPQLFDAAEVGRGWTIREGDVLLRGTAEAPDGGAAVDFSMLLALPGAATVVSVSDNDFGRERMRHWEVCAR